MRLEYRQHYSWHLLEISLQFHHFLHYYLLKSCYSLNFKILLHLKVIYLLTLFYLLLSFNYYLYFTNWLNFISLKQLLITIIILIIIIIKLNLKIKILQVIILEQLNVFMLLKHLLGWSHYLIFLLKFWKVLVNLYFLLY